MRRGRGSSAGTEARMSLWKRVKWSAGERLARNWTPAARRSRATGPIVSFTFDDFPKSAVSNGARILEAKGVRGSYYAAGCFVGLRDEGLDYYDREDLSALTEAGHEIGCHTFGHLRLPFTQDVEIIADLARNRDFINDVLDDYRMSTFAYPFGHVDVWKKALIGKEFPVSRGIFPGVNRGRVDFQQLKAIPMERRSFGEEAGLRALDEAVATNGWVVFFVHDVSDDPSPYGCTADTLARMVDAALSRGMAALPVREAAEQVRFGQRM